MTSISLKSNVYELNDLKPTTLQVLKYIISSRKPASPSKIIENVKCSRRSVQYALKELSARGIIEKKPFIDDMRKTSYILSAEVIRSRSFGLLEIRLI
ncbi:MAG: hypothetical protein ACXAEU_23080 [Candidatus Hodarchaeales archaeon]|jgi:predicted transcriptional regulator